MEHNQFKLTLVIVIFLILPAMGGRTIKNVEDDEASEYMKNLNEHVERQITNYKRYMSKVMEREENEFVLREERTAARYVFLQFKKMHSEMKQFHWTSFKNQILKRQFELYSRDYLSVMPFEKTEDFIHTIEEMHHLISAARITIQFEDKSDEKCKIENSSSCPENINMDNLQKNESTDSENVDEGPYKELNVRRIIMMNDEDSDEDTEDNKSGSSDEDSSNIKFSMVGTAMVESRGDEDGLIEIWSKWQKTIGKEIQPLFKIYNSLVTEIAETNGFQDPVEMLMSFNEFDKNFMEEVNQIWENSLKLHYVHLHTYAKSKLRMVYPKAEFTNGLIPEHIYYNLLLREASDLLNPLHSSELLSARILMHLDGVSESQMIKEANKFYKSLGFPDCHESISEFLSEDVNYSDDLINFDQSLRIIHVFQNYRMIERNRADDNIIGIFGSIFSNIGKHHAISATRKFPYILRTQDNLDTAIEQAIFDTMAIAATTITFFKNLGMISSEETNDENARLRYSLGQFLDVFLEFPAIMAMESWKQDVLRRKIENKDLNKEYWRRKMKYQGMKYITKPDDEDFDAATEFTLNTVDVDLPLKRFVTLIIQYQFFEALCLKAEQFNPSEPESKPLSECDIRNNEEAGKLLKRVFSLGNSKPWRETLKEMTGSVDLDVKPMLNYFAPALKFLNEFYESTTEIKHWNIIDE